MNVWTKGDDARIAAWLWVAAPPHSDVQLMALGRRRRSSMKRVVSIMVLSVLVLAIGISSNQIKAAGSSEPDSSAPDPVEERGVPMPMGPGQAMPSFPIQPKTGKPCPPAWASRSKSPHPNPDVCISSLSLNETRHVAFTVRNIGGARARSGTMMIP